MTTKDVSELNAVRKQLHELASRLEENGIEWAAVEISCHITPTIYKIANRKIDPTNRLCVNCDELPKH